MFCEIRLFFNRSIIRVSMWRIYEKKYLLFFSWARVLAHTFKGTQKWNFRRKSVACKCVSGHLGIKIQITNWFMFKRIWTRNTFTARYFLSITQQSIIQFPGNRRQHSILWNKIVHHFNRKFDQWRNTSPSSLVTRMCRKTKAVIITLFLSVNAYHWGIVRNYWAIHLKKKAIKDHFLLSGESTLGEFFCCLILTVTWNSLVTGSCRLSQLAGWLFGWEFPISWHVWCFWGVSLCYLTLHQRAPAGSEIQVKRFTSFIYFFHIYNFLIL